jgi:hypothetical protein
MPLLSASLDAFIFTSLAITLPYIYITLRAPPSANRPPLRTPLNILLLFHTLYIVYTLFLKYPPNLFAKLNIPLETPTPKIRALLTSAAGGGKLPASIEELLTKLGSFEVRTLYVRSGLQSTFVSIQTDRFSHWVRLQVWP